MDIQFWLLQSIGWFAITLLQLLAEPADVPVPGASTELLAVVLTALAVIGSNALRGLIHPGHMTAASAGRNGNSGLQGVMREGTTGK